MDYTDYLLWKLIALCVLAGIYNFWIGFTGRKPPRQSEQEAAQRKRTKDRSSKQLHEKSR